MYCRKQMSDGDELGFHEGEVEMKPDYRVDPKLFRA